MKNLFNKTLVMCSLLLTGCAVGPLVNHETGRTVGKHNSELVGGYGRAGYVAKWSFGLGEDVDFGVQFESLSIGIRLKYAFVNNHQGGWSFAGAIGAGDSLGGSHYYGDVIGSYLTGNWEPYGSVRIVHVKMDPLEFKDKDTGSMNFTINVGNYDYGQVMAGTRYWFTQNWLFSAEMSTLFAITSGVKIHDNFLVGGAFGYRF